MSFDTLGEVNWLAALVAAVAWFVFGSIWYARPVFGAAWQRAGGVDLPEGYRPGPGVFIGTLILYFVGAVATAWLARSTGSSTVGDGLILGLAVGIGYGVVLAVTGAIFGGRKPSPGLFSAISAGYEFLSFILVAIIVTVWT